MIQIVHFNATFYSQILFLWSKFFFRILEYYLTLRGRYVTNQTHAIPVTNATISIDGACHPEDQLIGKVGVPRNHLLVQECVIKGHVIKVHASCFGGRVVVVFLVGDVIQVCARFCVMESKIDRNENGSGVPWKGNWDPLRVCRCSSA